MEQPTRSAQAWNNSSSYVGGDVVTYDGKDHRAKWWTQGNKPGTEQWGPWETLTGWRLLTEPSALNPLT
jgi:chitinase